MEELVIEELLEATPDTLTEGLDLLNRTQGLGYFEADYILNRIQSPHSMCITARIGERLAAIGAADIITDFSYYEPFEREIADRLAIHKVGSLSTLSVVEEFQGKGLGQRISRFRLNWLKSMDCTWILAVSWVSGRPHTSKRVFEKLGFKEVNEVPEFYKKFAKDKYFECVGCHQQPCICPAILFESPVEALY